MKGRVYVWSGIMALFAVASMAHSVSFAYRYADTLGGGDRVPSCVSALPDGTYAVAGYATDSRRTRSSAWLMHLDSSGNLLWSRVYGETEGKQFAGFTWIEETSDSQGLVAAGWVGATDSHGTGGSGLVVRIDLLNGNVSWSWRWSGKDGGKLTRIRPAPDGNSLIVAGHTAPRTKGVPRDGLLMKLDSSGSLIWRRSYDGSGDDLFLDVQPLPSGGYVVAGSTAPSALSARLAWILGLRESGEVAWAREMSIPASELTAISSPQSGRFVVAGWTESQQLPHTGLFARMTSLGEALQIWAITAQDFPGFEAIADGPGGALFVAGSRRTAAIPPAKTGQKDGLAVRISPTDRIDWKESIGAEMDDAIWAVDAPNGRGVVWAGETSGFHGDAKDCMLVSTSPLKGRSCMDAGTELQYGIVQYPAGLIDSKTTSTAPITASTPDQIPSQDDQLDQRSFCSLSELDGELVVSRNPQSDGVTVRFDCWNTGRDSVPFKAKVYFSETDEIGPDSLLLGSYDIPALPSQARSNFYYAMNVKGKYKYAIALIDSEGEVRERNNENTVVVQQLP